MSKVHLRYAGKIACGVGKRWSSQEITSVKRVDSPLITCKSCAKLVRTFTSVR